MGGSPYNGEDAASGIGHQAWADAESELRDELSEDLDILRVLHVLALDMHWTWAVPTLADPNAIDEAAKRGFIITPPDPRLKVHMTDAGAHKLHDWYTKILPVSNQERFRPLWVRVTRT
ncbi:hypothetical protein [Saccharopolyspora hattusasensis]|uniref:hypothetical protein n=1 Tax=Saccharopolyspora hattusasensis TaxID=1128679 RepID=UPI003D95A1F9